MCGGPNATVFHSIMLKKHKGAFLICLHVLIEIQIALNQTQGSTWAFLSLGTEQHPARRFL